MRIQSFPYETIFIMEKLYAPFTFLYIKFMKSTAYWPEIDYCHEMILYITYWNADKPQNFDRLSILRSGTSYIFIEYER